MYHHHHHDRQTQQQQHQHSCNCHRSSNTTSNSNNNDNNNNNNNNSNSNRSSINITKAAIKPTQQDQQCPPNNKKNNSYTITAIATITMYLFYNKLTHLMMKNSTDLQLERQCLSKLHVYFYSLCKENSVPRLASPPKQHSK